MRNPHIRTVTELAAAIPFALPFVVIAFGILRLTGQVFPGIQGTFWLLLLGHAAIAKAIAARDADAARAAMHRHIARVAREFQRGIEVAAQSTLPKAAGVGERAGRPRALKGT